MFKEEYKENLTATCRLLGINRQVYYRAQRSSANRRSTAAQVIELVKEVRLEMPRLGTRKLYHILKPELQNLHVGRDRLFTILKSNHMLIAPKRQYHITTNSHHRFRKHKNQVPKLRLQKPEQLWVSDITYVGNRKNPMYLALVTDAYSKKIVGYDLSDSLCTSGSLRALKMGIVSKKYNYKLLHHSDRGFQYCSNEYQRILAKHRINCSMTESYDPYENAVAERVNGILKQEFLPENTNIKIEIMNKVIKNAIEIYNNKRPHLSCAYHTPNQMHQQNKIKIKSYKTKKLSNDVVAELL